MKATLLFPRLMVVMVVFQNRQVEADMKTTASFLGLMVVMVVYQNRQVEAGTYCVDNMFLGAGQRGVVSCDFGEFYLVGWLYSTQHLESTEPFIYLEGSVIRGPESQNGEYSMLPNGSLVIEDVSINHEQNYTVRIVRNGPTVSHFVVSVKVYVLPIPEYPVVNGQTDHQRVVIRSSDGTASLKCTMDNVRPAISLEVSHIPKWISMTTISSTLNNSDGTHNVSLDARLEMRNGHPVGVYDVRCRVAGNFAPFLKSVTTISLVVHDGHGLSLPSVEGYIDRPHLVLDVNQGGELTCFKDGVSPNVTLTWELISPNSSDELIMNPRKSKMCDNGMCSISNNVTLWPNTRSLMSAILNCKLSVQDFEVSAVTVEALFSQRGQYQFPLVNGMENGQHIVLDVNREGKLNCSMDRVSQNVHLEWSHTHHYSSNKVALERSSQFFFDNGDGTYNIASVTSYKAIDDLIQSITLKCRVLGDAADIHPLFTTVELHFPATGGQYQFPLVNAMENRQHVVLDVNREGELTCSMDRVSPNVNLEWSHTHHYSSNKVALERSSQFVFDNGDGMYNIASVTSYKAIDDLIQSITLKCRVSGDAADLYPLYTTVELHFPPANSDSPRATCQSKQSPALPILFGIITALSALSVVLNIYLYKIQKVQKNQKDEVSQEEESASCLTRNGDAVASV